NASSSEELAATAEEMSSQAEQLQQAMSFFKLAGMHAAAGPGGSPARQVRPSAKPSARKPARGFAVAPLAGGLAFAGAGPDESQFTNF
ncbi:MAG: histidine kinase, partial [Rhizobacter sp.]|nr:histidine kinase [Rhizobacter sp.]